jgi:hypothetical protein
MCDKEKRDYTGQYIHVMRTTAEPFLSISNLSHAPLSAPSRGNLDGR